MDLGRIDSMVGIFTLLLLIATFVIATISSRLGALSLASMTVITSLIYFFLMPVVALAHGDEGFFGMYIGDMVWAHTAVLLYALGAIAAFIAHGRVLTIDPSATYSWDQQFSLPAFYKLWAVAVGGVITLVGMGKFNILADAGYQAADDVSAFGFIFEAMNMLIPLTLVYLMREKFSLRSLAVLACVLFVFLQMGFRFRILILLVGVTSVFTLQRGIKIGILKGLVGAILGLLFVTALGAVRRYGQGIDLAGLSGDRADAMSGSFGGEFGIVYVLDYISSNPLPPPVPFEPWIVGVARLIPSFLWQDKPLAESMKHFLDGSTVSNADQAGVAASQHVEFLLQMGWLGVTPLAFLYFSFGALIVKWLGRKGPEVRMAGAALVPAYFGFYMQTRGYFFQVFSDGLFILGPLFLLTETRTATRTFASTMRRQRLLGLFVPK